MREKAFSSSSVSPEEGFRHIRERRARAVENILVFEMVLGSVSFSAFRDVVECCELDWCNEGRLGYFCG